MPLWNHFRHHFGIQRRPNLLRKCSQNPPARLKPDEDRRKSCRDVSRNPSEDPKTVARGFKWLPRSSKMSSPERSRLPFRSQCTTITRHSQCAPHKPHSWVYEAWKNSFSTPKLSTYGSQFAIHITYFPFVATTSYTSQLVVYIPMQCTVHYCAICPSFRVRSYLHDSECELLTSEFERPP